MNQTIPNGYIEYTDTDDQDSAPIIPEGFIEYSDTQDNNSSFDIPDGFEEYIPERSLGEAAADTAIGLTQGAVDVGGLVYTAADMLSGGELERKTGFGKDNIERTHNILDDWKSDSLKSSEQEIADTEGFLPTLERYIDNPDAIAQGVTRSIPSVLGPAAGGQIGAKIAAKGLTGEAAKLAAKKGATHGATVGIAATEGLSNAQQSKNEVLGIDTERLYELSPDFRQLVDNGVDPITARDDIANQVERITLAITAPIAGVAGKLTGAAGLEGMLGTGLGKFAGNFAVRGAKGAVTEASEEAIQSGSGQFAQNVGTQQYVDPNQSLTEGVPEAAASGIAIGGPMGGAMGAISRRNPDDLPVVDDQGNVQAYKDSQTGETYSPIDVDNQGLTTNTPQQRTPDQATGTLDRALLKAGVDAQNPVSNSSLLQSQIEQEFEMIQSALNAGELSPEQAEVAIQRLNKLAGNPIATDVNIPVTSNQPMKSSISQQEKAAEVPVNLIQTQSQQNKNSALDERRNWLPEDGIQKTKSVMRRSPNWQENELGDWIDAQGNTISLPSGDTTDQTVTAPVGTTVTFQTGTGKTVQAEIIGTNSKGNYRVKMPSGITVTKKPSDIELVESEKKSEPLIPGNRVSFTNSKGKPVDGEVTEMVNDKVAKIKLDHNGKTIRKQVKLLTQLPAQRNETNESTILPITEPSESAFTQETGQNKQVAQEKIEDVGEKIGGARKDVWTGFREKISAELSEDEIIKLPLSKTFPESDYAKLSEQGADPTSLALIKAMRDEIPAKGRSNYKKNQYKTGVIQLREAAAKILDDPTYAKTFLEKAKGTPALKNMTDKVALMVELGFPQKPINLKNITLRNRQYSMYNGVEGKFNKWIVDDVAKSRRSFGSTGGQIAVTDTREDAIKALKEYLEKQANNPKGKRNTKFEVFKYRGAEGAKGWIIGKKMRAGVFIDVKKGFESSKEARGYLDSNQAQLESELKTLKTIPNHRRDVNEERVGDDYREDENVTANDFKNKFGFKGVEFGNWVNQSKRQQDINEAYDGLMDLSHVLGVPPEAVSLNGELSIAFGARGSGGKNPAKAHYESDKIVINLTKKNGAGSLAHEFFHGLDNYFSRMRGEGQSFVTDRPYELMNKGIRPEVLEKFKAVVKAITDSGLPNRSAMLDRRRSKAYWAKVIEMSARSFESYVIDKLKAKNVSNDYLANIVSEKAWGKQEGYPYPKAEDKESINKAFDDLFSTIKTKKTTQGTALFSRAKTTDIGPVLSHDVVVPIVNRVMGRFIGLPFEVVTSESALPDKIQKDAKEQGATGEIKAVYWRNKVYVVSDTFHSDLEVEEAVLHEVAGHYGSRVLYGKDIEKVFNRLYSGLRASGVRKIAQEHGINLDAYIETSKKMTYDQRAAFLVDELLAHLQGAKVYESLPVRFKRILKEFIGAIRHKLKQKGFINLSKLSDSDLAYLLRRMNKAAQDGKTAKETDKAAFMVAYHGTPHEVDKFSTNKIGTGEGAQAQGWGLYFAGERGVAEYYQDKLKADGTKGNLYGVDLKPEQAEYLDWDKPLTKQSQYVRDAIINMGMGSYINDTTTGKDFYNRLTDFYKPEPDSEWMIDKDEAQKQASSELFNAGIRGNKYMDAASRMGGEGDFNYVIFSDEDIEITARFSRKLKQPKAMTNSLKDAVKNSFADKFQSDFLDNATSTVKRHIWGALTVRQIAETMGKQMPVFKDEYIGRFKQYETDQNVFKEDAGKIAMARQKLPKGMNEKLAALQHEATIEDIDPSKPFTGSLNQKKTYQRLKNRYLFLSDSARKVFNDERDFHIKMHKMKIDALVNRIANIEASEGFKKKMMDKLQLEFEESIKNGFYAPLARHGSFWVSTSDSFDMFESEGAQQRFLKQMREQGTDITGYGKKLENLQSVDGVSGKFLNDIDALIGKIDDTALVDELRDSVYQLYLESLPSLSSRKHALHRKATAGFSKDQARAFADKAQHDANAIARLRHLHIMEEYIKDAEKTLDIASSRTLQNKYKQHIDHLTGALNFNGDVTGVIDSINKDKGSQQLRVNNDFETQQEMRADIQRVIQKERDLLKQAEKIGDKVNFVSDGLSELRLSHQALANPNTHPIAQMLNSLGFTWFLGATPAAALVNISQTPTVALPMMAADKRLKGSARQLLKATKQFMTGKFSIELSLNKMELQAFDEWHQSGLLENTLAHDLAGVADSGIDTGSFRHKFQKAISFMFHHAERMNREVTAIASYRAARATGTPHTQAVKIASDITWKSHFDYAAGNRARFMRGNTARVVTQFKQYSQNITYLYAKTFMDAFKGSNKEDKAQARKLLYGMLTAQFAVAGTLGLPLAGIVVGTLQGLSDGLGDDDDPRDIKAEYRQFLSDNFTNTWGQVLAHGFVDTFTPLSVSGRLSLSDLWIRTSDRELQSRQKALDYINALGGPMIGIFTNSFVSADMIADGNVQRGMEYALPKAVKDVLKSARYAHEGAQTLKGTPVKDMEPVEIIAQMLGFSSSELSEIYEQSTAIKNVERKRTNRRKELITARLNGENVGDEIREWNRKNPRNRITFRTIQQARRSRYRYRLQTHHGVRETKTNRDLVERYSYVR